MPNASDGARQVTVQNSGPLLIEGPVEVRTDDGTVCRSDRFVVAVCTCRRSRAYPWCDTSHRRRAKPSTARRPAREERRPDDDRGRPDDDHGRPDDDRRRPADVTADDRTRPDGTAKEDHDGHRH